MTDLDSLLAAARAASARLRTASTAQKNAALLQMATALLDDRDALLEANARDVAGATKAGQSSSFIDRLVLTADRIAAIADGIRTIAALPDPVGRLLHRSNQPNGLTVERVAVPIGVLAMIYESRPNVGADAGALCLKSGNAVILRGGSESLHSTRVIARALQQGLQAAALPVACIQAIQSPERRIVHALLTAVGRVDLAIPRGGKGLIRLVQETARIPALLHLDGNCHTYIHEAANPGTALSVLANAKLRRVGVCGATESLVVDRAIADRIIPVLDTALPDTELRGDPASCVLNKTVIPADDADWGREYLDRILSVRVVDGLEAALAHIRAWSSGHTDAILTEDADAARRFFQEIDSAIVMHNSSTQFADGGEFGMGAEIGIATGRLHARGPVGLEQLTTFHYRVSGNGQVRP